MSLGAALSDGVALTHRNLIKIKRVPDLLTTSLMGPIMSLLLFAFVFGSAIEVPGLSYREFLIAGIFTQTIAFNVVTTGSGLADDIQRGIMDRLRTLPISSSAVLVGRTTSDLMNNALALLVMSLTGLLIGWRVHTSVLEVIAGFLLLLLFGYAMSWVMAVVGLSVRAPEMVTNASFMVVMPLSFVANTYVSTERMPGVLRVIAEWNPISAVTQAARNLFGNVNPAAPPPGAWPLQNAELASVGWIVVIMLIFVPLAIQRYNKAVSR
ncbi:ABC transporter [Lentzea guizhouensis]|uniref:Transport permease protein n=1 Tax=Lentzea guizhouensis TaxID=1586287 RepID=A0A1B2HQ31_9PSEU|nr:ABC transporter permease [Lentzea guizhouensis]ANZ39801.1 ABC transporter [Lentzea guizhouensis]